MKRLVIVIVVAAVAWELMGRLAERQLSDAFDEYMKHGGGAC